METDTARPLATARCIATLLYVLPLILFPIIGRMVKLQAVPKPEVLRLLGVALLVVGLADYAVSLFLEQKMLAQAARAPRPAPTQVLTAAIVVASFGASLAIYGLVITLLGAPGWGAVLYVICAVHGLHLMVRWPRYERAVEREPYL